MNKLNKSSYEKTLDIIFGRWKSQILYAAVKLRIFDNVSSDPKESVQITKELGLDDALTYRLLMALASLGFLKEEPFSIFSITMQGELMRKDHPNTLQSMLLL